MPTDKPVVLVSGSSGLIGAATIPRLADEYDVVGFDRSTPPHPPPEAECVCVDITSDRDLAHALKRVRHAYGDHIASVVHLAAYYDFSGRPSPKYESVTVEGTRRLLRGLQDFEVDQFVFSSTMLVHAPTEPGRPLNEDAPLAPAWDYPRSKVTTEELLRRERGRIPLVILRIAGVYTEQGQSPPLVNQVRRLYEGRSTAYFYPGNPGRGQSFVHLEDTVEAIVRTVDKRNELPSETVLLIGEPETVGYGEIESIASRELAWRPIRIRRMPKAVARWGTRLMGLVWWRERFIRPWMVDRADDHYELDVTRARDLLGWEPQHRLRRELPAIVRALKDDPMGWYATNKLKPPPALVRHAPPQRARGGRPAHGD